MVLPETSKNDRGTDVLSLNSPLIVPNIQKETVANTINKDTKRGKKVTLGVVKHWNRLSRLHILVDAHRQLHKLLSNMIYHPRWI